MDRITVDRLVEALTPEEKASLCSGRDMWTTKAVGRLDIPSWTMTDGPHGLRLQKTGPGTNLLDSVPATCFPTGSALASTWNRSLVEEVGRALGRESKAHGVGVILGPGTNLKRSPLCGRNFEYFSEDPYLAGQLAKHHILGVQSQGVGASLKHFAANNQEKSRMTIDAVVDDRTLRELYLPAFETAVKEARPWTVMCAYNRLNGTYVSENSWLLTKVLREEWGFGGVVVSDWGAAADRVKGLQAGLDLEMPGNGGLTDAEIVTAVKNGTLGADVVDRAVRRNLELTLKVADNQAPTGPLDPKGHHDLARRAAGEALVLLKNDGGLLPLGQKKIALVGEFARKPRYQGGGSSHITPTRVDDAVEEARALAGPGVEITYTPGYGRLDEARVVAKEAEVAVVFVGLTEEYESEGFDRTHLNLPPDHLALVEAVLEVQKNVVVVLSNGAPVVLPWVDRVPALVEGYLGGQAWGGAVADLLFGRTNPSGKLAETFPVRVEDNPSFLNFPGGKTQVEYREGPFVGYRHYDALRLAPLFPFGHGLSYTTFGYGPLVAARTTINEDDPLTLTVEVTNTGPVAGAEVVQLYVADLEASVVRPVRELKGFEKLWLEPGETKTVKFVVDRRAWAFWSGDTGGWTVETGQFDLAAGSSSRDLRQTVRVTVRSKGKTKKRVDQNTPFGDLADRPVGKLLVDSAVQGIRRGLGIQDPASPEARFAEAMVREMPLRNLIRMSAGRLPRALIRFLDRVIPRSGPGRHP